MALAAQPYNCTHNLTRSQATASLLSVSLFPGLIPQSATDTAARPSYWKMPAHRISHAVSRLFKAIQRQHTTSNSTVSYALLATESLALSSSTLPSAFFKQVKSLMAQQLQLHKEDSRLSTISSRSSLFSLSGPVSPDQRTSMVKSRKRQYKDGSSSSDNSDNSSSSSDCYVRLAVMLANESDEVISSSSSSMRSVAVHVAVETLLQLWEFLLQLLQSDEGTEKSAINKQSVFMLLQAIVQRPEFDVVLNSLASGQCSPHRSSSSSSSDTRKRRVSSVRLERLDSFRVVPATSTTAATIKKSSRRSFLKKSKRNGGSSATPLCLLVRQYLELHQSTLQFTEDALMASKTTTSTAAGPVTRQIHDLLAALVATSFIRIPFLREKILEKLQQVVAASNTKKRSGFEELHNSHQQSPLALFNWHHSVLSKCCTAMSPYNRDEFWYPSVHFVETVLEDTDARMLLCGSLIQHFTNASAWGRVEWKRIPGFAVLVDVVLLSTETLVQSQMRLVDTRAPTEDDHMERASAKRDSSSSSSSVLRDSFSNEPKDRKSSPGAFFFRQSLKLLQENPFLIHATLMVIFKSTNYMLPQHVEICLQYLERFITVFPRYFKDESIAYSGARTDNTTVDIPLMHHVFTCLLESEHFEILKVAELFLLKYFGAFSHSLRSALIEVFAAQFRRLFLHWHRDVRFCFFHVLIYLTYAGNRIVLCARSDESILGAEASQLFEIPGLVRTSAMAAWDVFDAPLHAMLTRHNRVNKQLKSGNRNKNKSGRASIVHQRTTTPSTWVDKVPFAELARSVPEYQRQVQTYFQCAKQFSLHEPVPAPVFYVKGAAPHS